MPFKVANDSGRPSIGPRLWRRLRAAGHRRRAGSVGRVGHHRRDRFDRAGTTKLTPSKRELSNRSLPPDATIVAARATRGANRRDVGRVSAQSDGAVEHRGVCRRVFDLQRLASAVVRRRGEAGILRAVGAQRGQIMRLFLGEAAVIGLFRLAVRIWPGRVAGQMDVGRGRHDRLAVVFGRQSARTFHSPVGCCRSRLGAGTLISVIAAIPAASEAASTTPRAALSSASLHTQLAANLGAAFVRRRSSRAFAVAGDFVFARDFGAFAAVGICGGGRDFGRRLAFLVPLSRWIGSRAFLRPLAERLGGIEGALAADNLRRALNRSSLVIAALLVSLALTIGMNLMVRSFRAHGRRVDRRHDQRRHFRGDFGRLLPESAGRVCRPKSPQFAAQLPGVTALDRVRQANVEIGGQTGRNFRQRFAFAANRATPFALRVNARQRRRRRCRITWPGARFWFRNVWRANSNCARAATLTVPTPLGPQ